MVILLDLFFVVVSQKCLKMATQANLAEIEDTEEDEANLKTVTDILPEIGTICRVCREVGKFEVWKILSFRDSIVLYFMFSM